METGGLVSQRLQMIQMGFFCFQREIVKKINVSSLPSLTYIIVLHLQMVWIVLFKDRKQQARKDTAKDSEVCIFRTGADLITNWLHLSLDSWLR